MSIEGIQFGLEAIKPISQPLQQQGVQGSVDKSGSSFGDVLAQVLNDVNRLQLDADQQIENVMTKKEGANIHDAMIALEKADVTFQFMTNLQQKIINAYQEIIRTQI
ncbi:MAG: flagellar hook-basal body complex protein FliE [Bdellovibrionota bacterium]|jgi:flagellar hook-basal body complex protein FliE